MSYLTADDLVKYMINMGLLDAVGVPKCFPAKFTDTQATGTLTAAMSGQAFRCAVDAVITLPAAAAATRGVHYKIICGALSSGTGLSISPAAADAIVYGTAVVNKDLINSGGSDVLEDYVVLECTGVAGVGAWVVRDMKGIWAKES